jgi:hypothetical protein
MVANNPSSVIKLFSAFIISFASCEKNNNSRLVMSFLSIFTYLAFLKISIFFIFANTSSCLKKLTVYPKLSKPRISSSYTDKMPTKILKKYLQPPYKLNFSSYQNKAIHCRLNKFNIMQRTKQTYDPLHRDYVHIYILLF